jgi:hypothetical protein
MTPENPRFRVRPLPRPDGVHGDRRKRRSASAALAIELALTSAAFRGGLEALLVVDDDGLLVARSRCPIDLSMLAAVTPIVGRGQAVPRIKREGRPLDLSVEPIELGGERFYVAALGGGYSDRRRELAGSIAATQRILA